MMVGLFKPPCLPGASLSGLSYRALGWKVEMRRLLSHAGRVKPVIVYPFALILSILLAYAWYLVVVGIILSVFVRLVGAD